MDYRRLRKRLDAADAAKPVDGSLCCEYRSSRGMMILVAEKLLALAVIRGHFSRCCRILSYSQRFLAVNGETNRERNRIGGRGSPEVYEKALIDAMDGYIDIEGERECVCAQVCVCAM